MAALTPYLLDATLPFKPCAAHLSYYTNTLATTLYQGHNMRLLSKAVLATGAVGCIALASIESISAIFIGQIGLLCNYLFFGNHLETMEKGSFQLIAFGVHSLFATTLSLYLAVTGAKLKYQTWNVLADRTIHMTSSLIVQGLGGMCFDAFLERVSPDSRKRITSLVTQIPSEWLAEIKGAAAHDLVYANGQPIPKMHPGNLSFLQIKHTGAALHLTIDTKPVERFAQDHQRSLAVFRNIDLFKLGNDPNYRAKISGALQRFVGPDRVIDRNVIKSTLLKIINSDEACLLLADDNPPTVLAGLQRIANMFCWEECLRYVQYQELLQPIQGADFFEIEKGELAQLSFSEKALLAKHILGGKEDLSNHPQLQELQRQIGEFAVELHRGNGKQMSMDIWKKCEPAMKRRIRQLEPRSGVLSGIQTLLHLS